MLKSMSPPFGLDISDLSIKLVSLDQKRSFGFSKKNKSINLLAYNQTEVPPGYFNEGKIVVADKIATLIKKLIKETDSPGKLGEYVISVLPETKAYIKLIDIPACPDKEIPQKIAAEIKNHFPFSPDEIYLDWQKVNLPASAFAEADKIKILISLAPKEIVEDYTKLLLNVGLKPFALEIESSAICRALLVEEVFEDAKSKESKSGTAIIDIGATRTSLIFYDLGTIQFTTSVPFAGQRITEKIAKQLDLSFKEAEKAKIKCGLDEKKCEGVLLKLLYEDIEEMVTKIKNSLTFYENHFPKNNPIKKIITCGGGANFTGINAVLNKELGIEVISGNPLINLKNQNAKIPKDQILTYATAIGLALRGILSNE